MKVTEPDFLKTVGQRVFQVGCGSLSRGGDLPRRAADAFHIFL